MSQSRSGVPLVVLVLCLLGAAGGLYVWSQSLGGGLGGGMGGGGDGGAGASITPTQLHEAARTGDVASIERAAAGKGDVNVAVLGMPGIKNGMTPLMVAAQAGKTSAVRALIKAGAKADGATRDGWTALHFGACVPEADVAKALLEAPGTAVNGRTPEGWTPVMLACSRGGPEVVATLLAKGADVSFRNRWGQSALALAVRSGSAEKVKAVLNAGPDVDAMDREQKTALHAAAEETIGVEVAQLLLDAKADPNKADDQGVTPLMKAADRGNVALAALLLRTGAKAAVKDANGQTARDWAVNRGDDAGNQIAELLK